MLRKLLFFSKYDGDKTNEKLDEILENQKNILDKIEKLEIKSLEIQKIMYEEIKKISSEISKNEKAQEKVLLKCSFLLEKQEKDNENIYGIVNQLLLKDLLKTHKNIINEVLSEKEEKKKKQLEKLDFGEVLEGLWVRIMIRDVNSQVEKAINEIEMRYSKGIKFRLEDLLSVSSCMNESNFANFRNSLKSKLINKRVAQIYSVRNDGTTYIKL